MDNPFYKSVADYKRDLQVIPWYVHQNAFYLAKSTGTSVDTAKQFMIDKIRTKGFFNDPSCVVLDNNDDGNRVRDDTSFLHYIERVRKDGLIMAPSMTAYKPHHQELSILAEYIKKGIADRSKAKKEMYKFEALGDHVMAAHKDAEQNAKKIDINSLSGMQSSAGTPAYFKSSHPTLTSMCRGATGYGNASNERFISGNRFYRTLEVVLANITVICTTTDMDAFRVVMDKYKIVYPEPEDVMSCIERSSKRYIRSKSQIEQIRDYVWRLSDVERAAVVYSGDLYHLLKHNPEFTLHLLDSTLDPVPVDTLEEADEILDKADDDIRYLSNYLHFDQMREVNQTAIRTDAPDLWRGLAGGVKHMRQWMHDHSDLIATFWRVEHMPPTIAESYYQQRDTVLTSDTDSTIFTLMDYVAAYTAAYGDKARAKKVRYVVTYFATQLMVHVLAQYSRNMGVDDDNLHRISMKNEYLFPAYALTSMGKHYYAFNAAREGMVYPEYKMEIKGGNLRPSNVSQEIVKPSQELMREVLHAADDGEQLSLIDIYDEIYDLELKIMDSVRNLEVTYLKRNQIKSKYKSETSSPLQHMHLWNEIFGPKYGLITSTPYDVVKVPLTAHSKTRVRLWIDSLPDAAMRDRARQYFTQRNKNQFTTIQLPMRLVEDRGIPSELDGIINHRLVAFESMKSYYAILESLGVYRVLDKAARLVSDFHVRTTTDKPKVKRDHPSVDVVMIVDEDEQSDDDQMSDGD